MDIERLLNDVIPKNGVGASEITTVIISYGWLLFLYWFIPYHHFVLRFIFG